MVAVIGAGTLGLLTIAAVSHLGATGRAATPEALLVGARYAHQRRWASELGATLALDPTQLARAVRRRRHTMAIGGDGVDRLSGGADVVFDCVGSADSIEQALVDGPRPGPGGPRRHARRRPRGPGAALAPRGRRCSAPTPTGPSRWPAPACARSTWRSSWPGRSHTGRLVSATYPLDRFEEAVAHAGRGRTARLGEGRLRPHPIDEGTPPMSPRPGFVLEVDGSTPPTLFWNGEGYVLEKLPEGSRVVYAPEPRKALEDPVAAVREALEHPLGDSQPLSALLFPGMRLTICFDDVSLPLPPMQSPDARQLVIEAVLDAAAAAGVDDVVLVAALALHRRMTEPELRHALGRPHLRGLRPRRPAHPARRRGPRQPDPPGRDRPRRGRRDQQAGGDERPARLREHHARRRWTAATRAWPPGSPATGACGTTTTRTP